MSSIFVKRWCCVVFFFLLSGCAAIPPPSPTQTENVCALFRENPDWYEGSRKAYQKWGVPVYIQAAIIYQESTFRARVKPPRIRMLGLVPLYRPSTAYGFAQVLDETWSWYQQRTRRWDASRHNFSDVADFIGWYGSMTAYKNGVSKEDAYHQYLAFHEGHRGFMQRRYEEKEWLKQVARSVKRRAEQYQKQLKQCKTELERVCCFVNQ